MCGQVAFEKVKSIMDGTNALMYRSHSSVRTRPKLPFVPDVRCETVYNSNCHLPFGIKVINTTIDGEDAEVLGMAVSYGNFISYQIIDFGDWNNDGSIDDNDIDALCIPWTEVESTPPDFLGRIIQEQDQAALVFIRNGTRNIEWDSAHNVWRHYRHSGSASSSMGFGIVTNNGMSDAGGNSFSHELGHYLGNTHTFADYFNPNLPTSVYDQLKEQIIAARDYLCPTPPSSCDPRAVVKQAFDPDDTYMLSGVDLSKWWNEYNQDAFELDNLPITDTPADPGRGAWEAIFGTANTCSYNLHCMRFFIDNIFYDVCPDRTNIMSYFKGCFPQEVHFSPIQKERAELAVTELHRKPITESIDVKTWRNKTEIKIGDATYERSHPVDLNNIPLKWATSKISVNDNEDGPVSRVVVGVRILQFAGEGALNIQLIDPNGNIYTLQQPGDNEYRILSTIQSLFYVNTTVKNGLWTLRAAEQPNYGFLSHLVGYLYDWQLQFEAP
jgi:hypothetical protein